MLFGFLGKGSPSPCCTPVGPCAHIFFLKKNSGWGGGALMRQWKPQMAAEANATPPAAPPGAGRVHFSIKCAVFVFKKTYTLLRSCGAACTLRAASLCTHTLAALRPAAVLPRTPLLHAAAHLPPWGTHPPLACMCRCAPVPCILLPLHPCTPIRLSPCTPASL